MTRKDLAQLDALLSAASGVVSMREVHAGARADDVIGLRHDVDDNEGSLDTAVRIAEWEAGRGYRSTYFMLHTASYWERDDFPAMLDRIAGYGHEIGIHTNAIAESLRNGGDPAHILLGAIERLRRYGHQVVGVVGHGDEACRHPDGSLRFVNDEIFSECARPEVGYPDREIELDGRRLLLRPLPLATFGLEYECYRLPRGRYLSDSGGRWSVNPASVKTGPGQLHILWHPDWWQEAFA